MPINVDIYTRGVTTKLNNAKDLINKRLVDEFNIFGEGAVRDAKSRCPIDEGFLRNTIAFEPASAGKLKVSIVAAADYAIFIECGTKSFAAAEVAKLPPMWQQYAAQFKGRGGGSFQDFILRLMGWIHRKGLGSGFVGKIGVAGTFSLKTRKRTGTKSVQEQQDKQAAYLIARKIMRVGVRPHPFFIRSVIENFEALKKRLKEK